MERVLERLPEAGRLMADGPRRCVEFLGGTAVRGLLSSAALGADVVSRLSCLDGVGDVTSVMAGCEDDEAEALTAHAGPCLACAPAREEPPA